MRPRYLEPTMVRRETRALSAERVIAATGIHEPGVVLVEGGLIKEVGPLEDRSTEPEFEVIAPGFCDLQVNGIGTIDVAAAAGEDWDALGEALLAQGVTTWCPTLVTAPALETASACERAAEAMTKVRPGHPEIAGVHLEGPFITVIGAHRREYVIGRIEPSWVESLNQVVRIVTLAPEVPGAERAIPMLREKGILVSLGHSACDSDQAHAAISAGARLVTHLGNASGPFHQRAPGLLGAALADDRVAVSLIADLEHVHADFLRLAFKAKSPGSVVLVTDAVAALAGTVGPVALTGGSEEGSAARLSDGTLAGSSLAMDAAVNNVVANVGIGIDRAVEAASTTPSRLLGLDDRGSISVGRRADLVALRRTDATAPARPRLQVEAVWVGGHLSWPL